MTDQDGEYTQDTSQEQTGTGGPEIPKTPETPTIGERVRNFFGGNKREKNPKQETPKQEAPKQEEPKQEQPKPRKYKDIWSMYEMDAYDENVPWQKEVKERMQADPEFKERWGKFNGWFSSGVKGSPKGYSKINEFNEDRSDEEKNWRRYKKAYGLSQDDDIDFGTDEYDRPIADAKGFKDLFEYNKDPTVVFRGDFGRDGFNDFWDTRGRYNKFNTTPYSVYADNPTYNNWYWSRNPFRRFNYKSSTRADATDDDRKLEELSKLIDGNRWGAGSARSIRLTNRGEFDDISANLYQAKRVRDIFGDEEDPDFFKFMDTIRDSEDPKDRALYDLYWRRGTPGMPSEKDYDRVKENYYRYREQQHGIGRDGKPINPQQEQPQPGPTQEPPQIKEVGGPAENVSATVDGKPVNAEIVTENNKLPATGREGVQETSQDVTQYKEPRETYIEPDDHPGPYTGAPKELGSGPTQDNGGTNATALAPSTTPPSGGGNNPPQTPSGAAPYDLKAERNALAKQHAAKFLNAFAQTAAEMGGQMASKGWDLAGNIVKMTFTQPHAMSSSSRLIGTAMSALQTAGDFADRSMEKYKIDANADPNLMKNTIRYKLYKREAQMGKNTVGNTFRAISESLGNMGLQDASQMTPDQLEQHVADMQAEADRLIQASKDPKLSAMDRSLIKAQADHLQGYMAGLGKQGATMAQNQRIAARRQRRQDLATRRQNYQILADGSPNPYKEALEWADPKYGIEVDPQTGRPTNPSAYNRMLNAVITQHQNEAAAAAKAGGKLDPAREKWFNDLQNKIHNDIQAMKQDKAENPLRGRAEIYARIGRVAPGFEKYIDNIEKTGTFPSNTTQSTRAIRKVLADYLTELRVYGKVNSPEYNHAKALLTSMDKYNNMKKLMSRIASLYPTSMERARKLHELANDEFVGEIFTDDGKIKDYMTLVQSYANLMKVLPRDPVGGGQFDPSSREYAEAEVQFNNDLTFFINKWFPSGSIARNKDDKGQGDTPGGGDKGDTPGGGTPGGGGGRTLEEFFNDDEDEGGTPGGGTPGGGSPELIDPTPDETDQFISEVLNELRRMGGYSDDAEAEEEAENPNPAEQPVVEPEAEEEPVEEEAENPAPQPPVDPKKGDRKANARFKATFPETKQTQLRERLHYLGFEFDEYGMVTDPQKYQDFKDQFLKLGVGENEFNKKFGRMMPLRMRSFAEQVYIARKQLAFGPEGAQNSLGAKSVNGARLNSFLVNNPDMAELMSKKLWGEPLTEEEELSVQKALFDAGLIKRIKTPKGDIPPAEEAETPVEEEAEQPQITVTENDFIKPEVASQFKDPQSIESINNGLAEIANSTSNAGAARAYDSVLWGLANELGDDALLSDEYKDLMDNALNEGSDRAFQLKANAAQNPDEKLMYLMARASLAQDKTSAQQSMNALNDFLNANKTEYDQNAVKKIVKNNTDAFLKVKSRKDGTAYINKMLSEGLDPSVKLNKGGDEEASVDEEVADPEQFAGDVVDQLDPSLFRQEEEEEEEEEIPLDEAEDQIDVSDLPQEFQDDLERPVERLPDGTAKWGDLYNFYLDNDDMVGTLSDDQDDRYSMALAKKVYDNLGDDPKGTVDSLINWINEFSYSDSQFKDLDELARIWDDLTEDMIREEDEPTQYDKLSPWDQGLYYTLYEALAHSNGYEGSNIVPVGDDDPQLQMEYLAQLLGTLELEFRDQGLWEKMGGSPEEPEEPEAEAPVDPNSTEAFEGGGPEPKELEDRVNKEYQKLEAKRDEEIKFATENLELPEGKSIDSITKDLMSEFNKKGGLSQGSKMPNVEKRIGKWLVDNEYCSDLKDPKLPGIARGLFASMCRSNLQKTLPKGNMKDPEPEGKPDDTNEGQALREEAERKKAVEALIQRVGPQGDLDDPSSVQKEFDEHISKLAKDLKGKYREKFQEAVKKRKVANIGKGTFKSPDPSEWTDEIRACTNRSELEKMKAAFEKYIDSSDEEVRDKMRQRLDTAYKNSKALKPINNVVKDIVDEILSNSNPNVYDSNKDDFQKRFDGALPEGTSDEQKSKLYSRIRHAAEVRKIMSDDFSSIPAADIKEPVGIARLGDEVAKRTAKGEEGLIEKYEKILKFRFPPEEYPTVSIPDMIRRLNENIAKEEKKLNPVPATKSESSIRDLFRARNADWE